MPTTTESASVQARFPRREALAALAARVRASRLWRRFAFAGAISWPVAASLALHVGLAAMILLSSWSFRGALAGGRTRTEVIISLPPQPSAPSEHGDSGQGEPLRPARITSAPPQLQGLASRSVGPLPALRSAASEAPSAGELLRRRDDAGVGATFGGLGARQATRIVYVVDASGAMVSSLKFVLAELERSVRSLSAGQKFQVVLFRDRPGGEGGLYETFNLEGGRARLLPATPANKAALSRWLSSITPMGRSNPLDGLRRGLEFEPDAIFLLSRSIRRSSGDREGVWGRGPHETMAELDRLNPRNPLSGRRPVVFKAIQFLEEDPTGTMQTIGTEHGDGPGSYAVLTLKDLGAK